MADTQLTPNEDTVPEGHTRIWDKEYGQTMVVDDVTAHSLLRAERFTDRDPALDAESGAVTDVPENTSGQTKGSVAPKSVPSPAQGQNVAPASDPGNTTPDPGTVSDSPAVQQET